MVIRSAFITTESLLECSVCREGQPLQIKTAASRSRKMLLWRMMMMMMMIRRCLRMKICCG